MKFRHHLRETESVQVLIGNRVNTLARLAATQLLVTVATSTQWLARLVGCPSLLLPGPVPPAAMGAELVAARVTDCQYCQQNTCATGRDFACLDVSPEDIVSTVRSGLARL